MNKVLVTSGGKPLWVEKAEGWMDSEVKCAKKTGTTRRRKVRMEITMSSRNNALRRDFQAVDVKICMMLER